MLLFYFAMSILLGERSSALHEWQDESQWRHLSCDEIAEIIWETSAKVIPIKILYLNFIL